MAKKTKDSNLSLEERLEQALIPNWDEPYKLPPNWCWAKFLCCSNIRTGKKDANYGSEDGEYPFFTCAADPIRCNGYSFDCHAILLAGNGDIGNISIYDGKFEAYQRTYVVETVGDIDTRYAYYYFKYKWEDYNKDKVFGTAIPYIRLGNLQDFPFPIAPMSEQERIVKQIESLFAKLDEAREKAQEVVDGFETRKAAILHKAFSGELTAKWREANGIKSNNWELIKLQDVCEKIVCGKTPTEYIAEHGEVPFLKVYNIVDNQIDFETTPQFIPKSIHHGKLKSSGLKPNDVIMNIVGPPLRKIAIIPDTYPEWNMNQAIVRFRPTEALNHKFLYYALINPETLDEVIAATRGVVGQANISVSQSRSLTINMPSWDEQIEVVRILDCIIEKEIYAKDSATAVIEQIDAMKKAILARAFRGELGTNDPSEESALELLKSVLLGNTNQQEPPKNNKKSTSIPNHIETALLTRLEKKIVSLFYTTESKVVYVDEIMSVSSKKIDIIDTLTKLEQRGIIIRLNNSCYRIKE